MNCKKGTIRRPRDDWRIIIMFEHVMQLCDEYWSRFQPFINFLLWMIWVLHAIVERSFSLHGVVIVIVVVVWYCFDIGGMDGVFTFAMKRSLQRDSWFVREWNDRGTGTLIQSRVWLLRVSFDNFVNSNPTFLSSNLANNKCRFERAGKFESIYCRCHYHNICKTYKYLLPKVDGDFRMDFDSRV